MAPKTEVEIPFSQLEYIATFETPMLGLIGKLQEIVAPFINALTPFGFVFDETEFQLTSPKARDHAIVFHRLTPPQMRVSVKWSTITVSVDQPDWSESESIVQLCTVVLEAIQRLSNAKVVSQHVSLGMHVQSKTTPRAELTSLLLTNQARELIHGDGKIVGQGIILHKENAMLLIDNSAAFANGLYVRIQRMFDNATKIAQIGEILLADEMNLWNMLGLEGEL